MAMALDQGERGRWIIWTIQEDTRLTGLTIMGEFIVILLVIAGGDGVVVVVCSAQTLRICPRTSSLPGQSVPLVSCLAALCWWVVGGVGGFGGFLVVVVVLEPALHHRLERPSILALPRPL